jgi:RNA polymerase sigma-70 factor (ECF subfamily)
MTDTQTKTSQRWDDDLRLAQQVVAGDAVAQAEFVARADCIHRFLARRNRGLGLPFRRSELEDLAQESFLRVLSRLRDFRGHATLESWVGRFCEFVLLDAVRCRERERSDARVHVAPSAESAHDGELSVALDAALATLPIEELCVIERHLCCQQTFEQIGAQLGQSPNTIKSRYYRALERLRLRLSSSSSAAPQ